MLTHDDDPIIALCTPRGKGALALIRISGTAVRRLVDSFTRLASGKKVTDVPSHTIHYGSILNKEEQIDSVMVIVMDGPKTFTGQDVIEITCHNNPFLIEAIIALAITGGARLAQEGEFTQRAFLQGKIDLIQAEAVNELINATTQHALKKSLAQLEGSFSHWITALEKDLLRTLAWCEASFEFLDEEKEFGDQIKASLEELLKKIAVLKQTFSVQQQIKEGIRIALIGSVNAGKSSLFNALLNQKRAIVTPLEGTTRDVIEAGLNHNGNHWTLIDTAGLRQTKDMIEQEGIKRSLEEAHKADIILLTTDGSRPLTSQEQVVYTDILETYPTKCILIHNKADIAQSENSSLHTHMTIRVSALSNLNIDQLHTMIGKKIRELFASLDSSFLLNQRQHALLLNLEQKLKAVHTHFNDAIAYELISYQLQDALTIATELTGKSISEAVLDQVFKEFCVGK